jgi:hypothetical protein
MTTAQKGHRPPCPRQTNDRPDREGLDRLQRASPSAATKSTSPTLRKEIGANRNDAKAEKARTAEAALMIQPKGDFQGGYNAPPRPKPQVPANPAPSSGPKK